MNIKPQWREEAAAEIQRFLETLNDPERMLTTCLTCLNFDETSEQCRLYNARPPARVIAYGCESYDDGRRRNGQDGFDDDIPF